MRRKHGVRIRLRAVFAMAGIGLAGVTGSGWADAEKAEDEELVVHQYIVPPNIHRSLEARAKEFEEEQEEIRKNREGLMELLERCGVLFPGDALAQYNPSTSKLMVRNTKSQMPIVESLIESMINPAKNQIFVVIREIRYDPDALLKEIGNPQGVEWLFWEPRERADRDLPDGSTATVSVSSVDELLEVMSQLPVPPPAEPKWTDERGIAAMFTEPQIQLVYRAFSELKEVDLLKPPTLLLRSEQAGLSRVDEKRWGVATIIREDEFGANESTIKLSLYLPREGEALYSENEKTRKPTVRVSLPNGQTVAFRDRLGEDEVRIVFVTAKIVDPAGLEIKPKPKQQAAPAESRPAAEIEKEREAIREADRIGLRGYEKLLAGDFKGAAAGFEAALEKLPKGQSTRRDSFSAQLKKAKAELKQLPTRK